LTETPEEKRKRILSLAKEAVTKAYSTGEHSLVQAINSYNEVERARNLLHERLEEWYGIYFPELETGSAEAYARFVMEAGRDKKQAGMEVFDRIFRERGGELAALAQRSIGSEPNDEEYAVVRSMAETELGLMKLEGEMDAFLKEKVPQAMPNISYLVDYRLAAELLAKAGTLQKLAVMPASTIQLLGAEKALFRHLRSGSKSPKYGALFKLKEVTVAERWNRGKVARIFATKISIAARADALSKRFIGKELKESLDRAMERISASPRPEGWTERSHEGRPSFRQNERFGGRPQRKPEFRRSYGQDRRPQQQQRQQGRGSGQNEGFGERPNYDRQQGGRPAERPGYNKYYDNRQRERPPFRKSFERRDERPAYRPSYNSREDRPATRPSYRPFNRFDDRQRERPAYGQPRDDERRHAFKPDHGRAERFGGVKGRGPGGRPKFGNEWGGGRKSRKKKGRSV
jgi:nucleolar protein 56